MDPLALLSRLFKKNRPPISPEEISARAADLDSYIESSRGKRLLVFDPPFWGFHDIFIDKDLRHALVSLKKTKEAFVFTGDTRGARRVRKYSHEAMLESEESLEAGMLEWIIYDDFVIYHGPFLPVASSSYYVGKVAAVFPFKKTIDDEWERKVIPTLRNWYEQHDRKGKRRKKR
ncbi:MAG: hypothetical protein ACLFN0_01785 [Thermovirgaceae bacterium]